MTKFVPHLALLIYLIFSHLGAQAEPAPEVIRVMTFNLWHGGDAGKQPLEQTVAVIKAAKADIVGLQETDGLAPKGQKDRPDNAAKIAAMLGWSYLDQGGRTGIISRFRILGSTPGKWGAKIELSSGQKLYHFNAHLAHAPYQPYQLLRIPYNNAPFLTSAEEAVQAAHQTHGEQIAKLLAEVKAVTPENLPIFITGDFNEPSHLDWTPAAAAAQHCPLAVEWPSTKAIVATGFVDAYRTIHPDPVKARGLTWTPTTQLTDPKDRHDRIDFIFTREQHGKVKSAQIVGEAKESADIIVAPYPSDHRSVVAEIELPNTPPK